MVRNAASLPMFILPLGVGDQLGLAASLGREKAEGDHLSLGQIQPGAGVVITKAVGCQIAVDGAGFSSLIHVFTKDFDLGGNAFLQPIIHGGGCLAG